MREGNPGTKRRRSQTKGMIQTKPKTEEGPLDICRRHEPDQENLVPALQDVQESEGYLSPEAVDAIADYFGLSPNSVYGVATFYAQFRYHPPGRHCLKICQGTACHVLGSGVLLDAAERTLGIRSGETTEDGEFGLEELACLGSCALAPAVVLDGVVHARQTPKKLNTLLEKARA